MFLFLSLVPFFLSLVPFFMSFDPFSLDLFLIPEKFMFLKISPPSGWNSVAAPVYSIYFIVDTDRQGINGDSWEFFLSPVLHLWDFQRFCNVGHDVLKWKEYIYTDRVFS